MGHSAGALSRGADLVSESGPENGAGPFPPRGRTRPLNEVGKSWMQSTLAWIAGMLQSGARLASRWAERDGNLGGTRAPGNRRNVLIVGAGGLGRRLASY